MPYRSLKGVPAQRDQYPQPRTRDLSLRPIETPTSSLRPVSPKAPAALDFRVLAERLAIAAARLAATPPTSRRHVRDDVVHQLRRDLWQALHGGQNPRRLQAKATRLSWLQVPQRTLGVSCGRTTQLGKASNSSLTNQSTRRVQSGRLTLHGNSPEISPAALTGRTHRPQGRGWRGAAGWLEVSFVLGMLRPRSIARLVTL